MPTIQANGCPSSAQERTRARCSGGDHSAAAASPPERTIARPAPTATWATASTAKLGAAALSSEPAPSTVSPASSSSRSAEPAGEPAHRDRGEAGDQAGDRAQLSGGRGGDVEVRATWASTGERAITPACTANRQRNSAGAGSPPAAATRARRSAQRGSSSPSRVKMRCSPKPLTSSTPRSLQMNSSRISSWVCSVIAISIGSAIVSIREARFTPGPKMS